MDDDVPFFQPYPNLLSCRQASGSIADNHLQTLGLIHPPSVTDESEDSALNFEENRIRPKVHLTSRGSSNTGFQPTVHNRQQPIEFTVVYDLRQHDVQDFIQGDIYTGKLDVTHTYGGKLIEKTDRAEGIHIVILGAKETEKYLQVKLSPGVYYCLKRNKQHEKITEQLHKINNRRMDRPGIGLRQVHEERRYSDFALINNNRQVTLTAFLELPNLAVVELVPVFLLVWRICYRYKLCYDKRYLVRCSSVASIEEVKCKFLDLFQRLDGSEEELSVDSVWLTQGNKVVTEKLVNQTFRSVSDKSNKRLKVSKLSHIEKCVDEVYVHFKPPDALCAEVTLKTDNTLTDMGLLVLSPEEAPSCLQEEVAKIVGEEPERHRISLGDVKLDSKIKLQHVLSTSDCKITVTAEQKIKLLVNMETFSKSGKDTAHVVPVYSQNKIQVLKKELCKLTEVPPHLVDLFFQGKKLDEEITISEYRLCNDDVLEGCVFPWRQTLFVRMPNRQWQELIVDDCQTVSIGQIKMFWQTLNPGEPVHSCELTAIAHDRVVSDSEILVDISAELPQRSRLILVQTECTCFTAASSYNGNYVVCSSTEGSHFDQISTMHNGKRPFYGDRVDEPELLKMVMDRRCSPQQYRPVPGIRLRPVHQHHIGSDCSAVMAASLLPSPSETSQASALNCSKSQTPETSSQDDLQKVSKSDGDLPQQTSPQRKKKSSSIGFHTGNSLPDMETAVKEPSTDNQEVQEQLTDNDHETSEELTTEDTAGVPSNQPVNVPDTRRGASCPSLELASISNLSSVSGDQSRLYESDSQVGKVLDRVTVVRERLWTVDWNSSSKARLTPEHVHQHLSSNPCFMPPSPPTPVDTGGQLEQYQHKLTQTRDPAFTYISQSVVQYTAQHLGREAMLVIRALGVTDDVICQAAAEHPNNMIEKHYQCLKHWCSKNGCKATIEVLKKVLKECDRTDIAEYLDDTEQEPSSSPHKAIKDQVHSNEQQTEAP